MGTRRPVFARELLESHPDLEGTVSLYNDCLMTNATDMGTYSNAESDNPYNFASTEEARAFAQTLSADVPFGGETCPDTAPRWADCANMVGEGSEPASLHMSYLHGAWADTARATWEAGGCYDEIKRRLGYRFELERVTYPPVVEAGERARVTLRIRNTGWARLHVPRRARLVLRSGDEAWAVGEPLAGYTEVEGSVSGDAVRAWGPGETAQLVVELTPPGPGTYRLHLRIPDADRPEEGRAIALATTRDGASIFDPSRGENDLGVTLEASP